MLKVGTRTSPLALAQTQIVIENLKKHHTCLVQEDAIQIISMETKGDKILNKPLSEFGGKGLFTKELEEALLDGHIDFAVHSLKDMSTIIPQGLQICAVLEREDPRDVFLSNQYNSLEELPQDAIVGTASLRRQAFIANIYPHLQTKLIRGNVGTRIEKMKNESFAGIILALSGIKRLGIENQIKQILPIHQFIPAPAQGVLAVQCRTNDHRITEFLKPVHHKLTEFTCEMERLFLRILEGSCKTPLAVFLDHRDDLYDLWYMSVGKGDVFTSECLRNLNKEDVPLAVTQIATFLKKGL